MSKIQALTDTNFSTVGSSLRLNIPGAVFVMFKSESCTHCRTSLPIIASLASKDKRVMWAIADVGKYKDIVVKARNTKTPLKGVPMFVLYYNGKPVAKYNGERTEQSIRAFLSDVLPQLSQSSQPQSFVPPKKQTTNVMGPGKAMEDSTSYVQYPQSSGKEETVSEDRFIPPGIVPHNAPFLNNSYKNMDLAY